MGRILKQKRILIEEANRRMLNESEYGTDLDSGDNPDTESKNSALGGALGMFNFIADAGKRTVEKRRKDMIPTIKKSEDILMKLIDLHSKYQTKDNIKDYFERFKDKSIDAYRDFYQNPDISEFKSKVNPFSESDTNKLIREIAKLYETGQQSTNISRRFYRIASDYVKDIKDIISDIARGKKMEEIDLQMHQLSDDLMGFIEENPIMTYKN